MIMSRASLFSDRQPITATAASTNVYDSGATGTVYAAAGALVRDLGKGTRIPLTVNVVQAFNNLTSLRIDYQVATDAAFTSPVTVTGNTYTLAQLNANPRYFIPDGVPVGANQRYHRLLYTVTGTAPSTGQITAGFTAGNQTNNNL